MQVYEWANFKKIEVLDRSYSIKEASVGKVEVTGILGEGDDIIFCNKAKEMNAL